MKCTDKKCVRCFYSKKTSRFHREDFMTNQQIKRWWVSVKDKPFITFDLAFTNEILKERTK